MSLVSLEPVRADLIEDLALPRDMGDDTVERRMPIGGDQNELVALVVDVADLAGGFRSEKIEVGLAQDVHIKSEVKSDIRSERVLRSRNGARRNLEMLV